MITVERRRCSKRCTPYNENISQLVNHRILQLFVNVGTKKKTVFIEKGTQSFGDKCDKLNGS